MPGRRRHGVPEFDEDREKKSHLLIRTENDTGRYRHSVFCKMRYRIREYEYAYIFSLVVLSLNVSRRNFSVSLYPVDKQNQKSNKGFYVSSSPRYKQGKT